MNYDRSGQYGAPRRKAPPSMPTGLSSRDSVFSRSDFSPSEYKNSPSVFANQTNRSNYTHDMSHSHNVASHSWGLKDYPLAMLFSPLQCFSGLYDEDTALARGTLFSELDLPFEGQRCGKDRC